MNSFSIWHGLIALLVVALVIGVRRIGPSFPAASPLFSAQPATTQREAEYVDDALPRKHGRWIWPGMLALACGVGWFVFYLNSR